MSERLVLLPLTYSANYYTCALPSMQPSTSLVRHAGNRPARPAPLIVMGVAILDKLEPRLLDAWVSMLADAPHAALWLLGGGGSSGAAAGSGGSAAAGRGGAAAGSGGATTDSGSAAADSGSAAAARGIASSTSSASITSNTSIPPSVPFPPSAPFARIYLEAAARGMHPARLRLLPRTSRDAYLRRLGAAAHLVLDTRVYSGHTTTLDALWVGAPVLTLEGATVAARVSAAHLSAAGARLSAPLLTRSFAEMANTARRLLRSRQALSALRVRVLAASTACAHLNWVATTASLERAHAGMWEARALGQARRSLLRTASTRVHLIIDPDLRVAGACPGEGTQGGAAGCLACALARVQGERAVCDACRRARAAVKARRAWDAQELVQLREQGKHVAAGVCERRLKGGAAASYG